jgi:hypothetical protein
MAAGLGFKTFTTGEVLSAGDTNGYLMQGVLVFASAAARDAAITSPQEGQFAYLKDTDATTYYSGSAWTTSGSSGLTKVTSNTFSAVSSVSLPNSTFTSTYTNYKIVFIISTSSASPAITGRYRASGTDNTASTYYNAVNVNRVDGSSATQNNVNAGTAYNLGYVSTNTVGLYGITLDFLSPQAAAKKQITGGGFGWNATVSDAFASYQIGGFFNNTTQFDAFSFISSTGTITGSYAVYGYQS